MKSQIISCDKCGEIISGDKAHYNITGGYLDFDLCQACRLLLIDWLEASKHRDDDVVFPLTN